MKSTKTFNKILQNEIEGLKIELSEKSDIPDLTPENQRLIEELKAAKENSEVEKMAMESKLKEVEFNLKKEITEANEKSAKLEQDLVKENEIHQNLQQSLQNEIEGLKVELSEKSDIADLTSENQGL